MLKTHPEFPSVRSGTEVKVAPFPMSCRSFCPWPLPRAAAPGAGFKLLVLPMGFGRKSGNIGRNETETAVVNNLSFPVFMIGALNY